MFYSEPLFWEFMLYVVKLCIWLGVAILVIYGFIRPIVFKLAGIPLDKKAYKEYMKTGIKPGSRPAETDKPAETKADTQPPAEPTPLLFARPEIITSAVKELAAANPQAAASVIKAMLDARSAPPAQKAAP